MRILYLLSDPALHDLHRGAGYRTHVEEMIAALRRAGHEVDLYDARAARSGGEPGFAAEAAAPGRRLGWLGGRPRAVARDLLYALRSRVLERQLARDVRGGAYDLVYERFHHFQEAGVRAARRWRVPHFLEFNAGQDEIAEFHGAGLSRWGRRVELAILKGATRVLAVSEVLRGRLVRRGLDPARVVTLHNAADPRRFHPGIPGAPVRARFGIPDGALIVGFVGSFAPWHGVDRLLDAAARGAARGLPLRYLLAGGDPRSERYRELERRLVDEKLSGFVQLAGRLPADAVPGFLAAVDIAIMPWTNEYGSPLKLFEYMAMAKAIVAPDRPVIREILRHEEEALLVGDRAEDVEAALRRLAEDPALRRRLADSVRRRVETEHNWDRHAAVVERLWREISSS